MALYVCKCGYPIWAEDKWNGLGYTPEYSDDWENSPTWGQPITHCPQCGEGLDRFHQWWIAKATTADGYLELRESGIIRIRESCPECEIPPDWAIDLFCEMFLTGGNENPYPFEE